MISKPDTVHTLVDVDVSATASPDVEVGDTVNEVEDQARLIGAENVIV